MAKKTEKPSPKGPGRETRGKRPRTKAKSGQQAPEATREINLPRSIEQLVGPWTEAETREEAYEQLKQATVVAAVLLTVLNRRAKSYVRIALRPLLEEMQSPEQTTEELIELLEGSKAKLVRTLDISKKARNLAEACRKHVGDLGKEESAFDDVLQVCRDVMEAGDDERLFQFLAEAELEEPADDELDESSEEEDGDEKE